MENKNYVHQKAKARTVKERKYVVTNFLKGRICFVYVLTLRSEIQPCVMDIRTKFSQHDQSRYDLIKISDDV
jgi:hypothetical protein